MSRVVNREPCPSCGSRDNVAVYEDGGKHCWTPNCDYHVHSSSYNDEVRETRGHNTMTQSTPVEFTGVLSDLGDRKIPKSICEHFGVLVTYDQAGSIDKHYYPRYTKADKKLCSTKIRLVQTKGFYSTGTKEDVAMFGYNKCKGKGRLTITEGELDAMAVAEMNGKQWDVMSLNNGAQGAAQELREMLDYIEKYDEVRFCFDMDEHGDKAWDAVKDILEPGKALRVRLPLKDANAMLMANRIKEFKSAWWAAEVYTPDGIVNGGDIWEDIINRLDVESVPYPYEGLNELTKGLQQGTVITVTSGSGMGKSQFIREMEHWLFSTTDDKIGVLALEESKAITGLGIMSIEANQRLHVDRDVPKSEIQGFFDKTLGTRRFYLFDHFGSTSEDNIMNRLRFMIKGCGCKWIFLDHLSIVVSDQEGGDERKNIDAIMTKIRTLAEETGATIFVVVHLKRPEGKNHEEGGRVTLGQLRGSGSIAQLSDFVVAFERNQQAEDINERNLSTVRVLKNRWTGETGVATRLLYDKNTGRMTEMPEFEGGEEL